MKRWVGERPIARVRLPYYCATTVKVKYLRDRKNQKLKEDRNMKQKLQIIIVSASAASLLAFSGLAQDMSNTQTNVTDNNQANESDTTRTNVVDNTARNVRDRNSRTLTPLDQGNSQADVNTTAQIRKEIIAGKDLSVNARNVKIITTNGRVTLRGPVNTAEEKRFIGEIADRIARSENVDNQLEVKLTSSNN